MPRFKKNVFAAPAWGRCLCAAWLSCAMYASAIVPEEQLQFADGLYVRGLYDLALDEYLVLSREAESFDRMDLVLYRIGECHRRMNNPEAAERFFQRVLREHPGSEYEPRAAFRRAELFVTRGRLAEGLELFQAFLSGDPDPSLAAPAWYYKGYAARRLGQEAVAEEALRRVVDQHPDAVFAAYAALEMADIYRDRPDRANDVPLLYARVLSDPPTPQVAAEAVFQKAEWWFAQGEAALSAEWYERLFREHPDAPRATEARLQAAWAFFNAGRYAEAAQWAREYVDDPEHVARRVDWLYLLANCQRQLLRTEAAQQTYARLVEDFPGHELARIAAYESALMSFQMDQYEDAISRARQLPADPARQLDLYWLLAESYAAIGRDDEAVQYYRLILDAGQEDDQTARALFRLARILQNRREHLPAARTYRQLADRFPGDEFAPQALFSAAFSMAVENRYEEAVQDWDRLLQDYGQHPLAEETRYQRALALLQLDDLDVAREAFADFLRLHADSAFAADAHYWTGVLKERVEDYAEAEEAYRAVLALDPDQGLADRARYRLALNLQRQGQQESAADKLQALLDTAILDDMPPALLEWLTRYRLEYQRHEEAGIAAQALLTRADDAVWRQIGWGLNGRALLALGKAEAARESFERSLAEEARTREGAEAAWYLGSLHLDDGQIDEAAKYLQRAAELAADDRLADVRARSYFGLARAAEAQEDWNRAARLYLSVGILFDDPELTPASLYHGAQALKQAGRDAEHARTVQELKDRYPDNEWAAKLDAL